MDYDVLVVGSGIGGMESALKLGDMGYKVLVVEKEASVGGKMILLSKVFPTLDCASCISTPKMAATIHHPNITALTYSEVEGIESNGDGRFHARIRRKARYVDEVDLHRLPAVRDGLHRRRPRPVQRRPGPPARGLHRLPPGRAEEGGHRPRAAARPARTPARPASRPTATSRSSAAASTRRPSSSSWRRRRSWARSGAPATPRARASAPAASWRGRCRSAASSASPTTGTTSTSTAPASTVAPPNGKRVAIVGSGPAGLTAAWQLARSGYGVKIFEAAPEPGGFLRLAIPAYRLPAEVVARDIENVTDIGVEIATSSPVERPRRRSGATASTPSSSPPARRAPRASASPARTAPGVLGGIEFLRDVRLDQAADLAGRRVVVVGGGNVAMDAARTARRLGRRQRDGRLPARPRGDAGPPGRDRRRRARGRASSAFLVAPLEVVGDDAGRGRAACAARGWASARPTPPAAAAPSRSPAASSCSTARSSIAAIGMAPDTRAFAGARPDRRATAPCVADPDHAPDRRRAASSPPATSVTGPTDITRAVGEGRRAAYMIDRWLTGGAMAGFDDRLPVVDKAAGPRPPEGLRAPRRRRRPTAPPTRRRATSTRSSRR